MISEDRRNLLEKYCSCETVLLEPKKSQGAVVAALREEVGLERDARLTDPFICIDTNGLSYALYIGEQAGAPLGVCIRRHFANFSDFLWIERTERSSAKSERWSAVLVQDGLATEEALNVPRGELRSMLAEIYTTINVITIHRNLLETWLPRSLGQGGQPIWVETAVSPLGGASRLAQLTHWDEALRQAKLKLNRSLVRGLQIAASVLLFSGLASGIYLYGLTDDTRFPWTESEAVDADPIGDVDLGELKERLAASWEEREVLSRPATAPHLKKAYEMLLEGWSIGLDITAVEIDADGSIELSFSDSVGDHATQLITAWCLLRGLEPHLNDDNTSGSVIGKSPVSFRDWDLDRRLSVGEFRDAAQHLGATPLVTGARAASGNSAFSPQPLQLTSPEEVPEGARPTHLLSLSVPTFGNPSALLYLAEDQTLEATFIQSVTFTVDTKSLSLGPAIELSLGAWKEL